MAEQLNVSQWEGWANCPAFPVMRKSGNPLQSSTAKEGTAAAWVAMMILTGQVIDVSELVGRRDPDGYAITGDVAANVKIYTDYVTAGVGFNLSERLHVEEPIESGVTFINDIKPDAWWYDEGTDALEIVDDKNGWRIVEPFGNFQLLLAAATIQASHYVFHRHQIQNFRLTIVQPNPSHSQGPIRTWVLTRDELSNWHDYILNGPAAATQQPDAPAIAAERQCRYCNPVNCAAARATGLTLLDIVASGEPDMTTSSVDLRAEQVKLRSAVKVAQLRDKSIEQELIENIRQGEVVEGIAIHQGQGNRKFKPEVTPEKLKLLGGIYGVKLTEEKPVSPAEAERVGLPETVLETLTTRGKTAPKIVDIDLTKRAKEAFE